MFLLNFINSKYTISKKLSQHNTYKFKKINTEFILQYILRAISKNKIKQRQLIK